MLVDSSDDEEEEYSQARSKVTAEFNNTNNKKTGPWWSKKVILHWMREMQAVLDEGDGGVASINDYNGIYSYLKHKIETP